MNKNKLIAFALILVGVSIFAAAQRPQPSSPVLSAADLDKLAAAPSIDQAILRAAAEKVRQEGKATGTVELQMKVRIAATLPGGCNEICVQSGNKWFCAHHCMAKD